MNRVKYKFKNIITVKNGSTPSTLRTDFYDGNIIWITPKDLSNDKVKYIERSERYITKSGYESCSTSLLPIGTVLLSSRAPIGLLAIVKKELCTNQGFKNLIVNSEFIDSEYLYYWLKTRVEYISSLGTGTTFKEVSKTVIEDLEIILPKNIYNQKKIAIVLSDLDAKIELNNKINSELEAMAKTLYDYWFVQFDFPDVDGKPYKTSGGKMVWNNELKREIPEGWEVDALGSWIGKDKSGDWGKEAIEGNYTEKVHCIRGADLNGLNGNGEVKAPTRYILEKNSHKILDPHDLIVEISGGSPTQSTGRMAFITKETLKRFDAPIICSNFCKAVTLENETFLYNFVFEWNRAYGHGVLFGFEGKTSGIKNLLFETFVSNYFVTKPPIYLAKKFYEFMEPLQVKKQKNLKENQQLASLRDWLLPMLMNGQVRVGDVEEELGMVAEPKGSYKK
jgi:type I restriction enzyme S subunit